MFLLAEEVLTRFNHLLLSKDNLFLYVSLDELADHNLDLVHRQFLSQKQVGDLLPDLVNCVFNASRDRISILYKVNDVGPLIWKFTTENVLWIWLEVL